MYKKCYIFFIFNLLSFTTTTLHNERKKLGTTENMAPQLFSFCASPRQRWLGTQWCASRCCTRTSSFFSNPTSTIDICLSSSLSFVNSRISAGTGSVLILCLPVGMWCDAALRIIARKVFSSFWQSEGNGLLLSLSSISCVKLAQLAFLRLT